MKVKFLLLIQDEKAKINFRKWNEKITSVRLKPFNLISQHRNLFKKLFNVVASTPESLATYVDFLNEKYDYVIFKTYICAFFQKTCDKSNLKLKIII